MANHTPAPSDGGLGTAPTTPVPLRIEVAAAGAPPADKSPEASPFGAARLVLDYLRVLAWPVFAAALLLTYRPPLGRMAATLARKFDAASKVSLGSLSLEVAARAREVGSPALADSIGELSEKAVTELLRLGGGGGTHRLVSTKDAFPASTFGIPDSLTLAALRELDDKGFVAFREPLPAYLDYVRSVSANEDDQRNGSDRTWLTVRDPERADTTRIVRQNYALTPAGARAVEAITKAVASQLARE